MTRPKVAGASSSHSGKREQDAPATLALKPALTPKLRFQEFRNALSWQQSELGKEASILKGKGVSKSDIHSDGTQPCIRYGELYTHYDEIIGSVISRTKTPANELFLSKANDVIIPSSGETKIDIAAASCVLLDNVALGGDLNVIRSTLNGPFLSYYLNGPKRFDIAKVAQGHTVVHLYPYQLEELEIAFPSPAEQQKIAECLSSLDELIGAESRKLDALKAHKKGLMQQLFPREDETLPRLRFPEFRSAPEWEEDKLGSVCELYQAVTLSASEQSMTGEYLVYGANGVIGSHREYNHEESEIAVTCRGATCGEVTITKPKSWITGNAMVGPRTSALRKDFIFHYFKNHGLKSVISGSAQPQITRTGFAPLVIFFPKPEEQHRIANCLSSLDDLIAAQSDRLSALQTHKQGLMQQLFPSPTAANA